MKCLQIIFLLAIATSIHASHDCVERVTNLCLGGDRRGRSADAEFLLHLLNNPVDEDDQEWDTEDDQTEESSLDDDISFVKDHFFNEYLPAQQEILRSLRSGSASSETMETERSRRSSAEMAALIHRHRRGVTQELIAQIRACCTVPPRASCPC